ncbi:hypothetical protein [Nocardia sp. NPDC058480]
MKVLAAQFSAEPEFWTRSEREADRAAGLSHPAIVMLQQQRD